MAVIEIEAKTLLATVKQPDELFGLKYNMNLYRGCQHQCIYCDSRSLCYGIENFQDILVKINGIELLKKELAHKRVKGTIGTGSMHDPYMPIEKQYRLTGQALELMAQFGFGVHVITKSDLVVRDVDLLCAVGRVHASVSFSISTTDDGLSRKIEPGAPPVSARFAAMQFLAQRGVQVGVTLMPVLPFIEDTPENIQAVVERAAASGARYIVPWFGMSQRDRQREYYHAQLDRLFPGLREKYVCAFGDRYGCPARGAARLGALFQTLCSQYGIATHVPQSAPKAPPAQLSFF
jgi:DNA repair photolyase